jgi:hypothetical protein
MNETALLAGQLGRQPRDKTVSFPKLDIATIHGLLCPLGGLLIVSALDIFVTPKVMVATDGVDAIPGHAALSQAGMLQNFQPPMLGSNRCRS